MSIFRISIPNVLELTIMVTKPMHHEKRAVIDVDDCTLPNIAENVDAWWMEEFQLTSVRLL